jgi:hypothetical protein
MHKQIHRVDVSDQQIDAARKRAKEFAAHDPCAFRARYDAKEDFVILNFADGVRVCIPRLQMQGLEKGSRAQLSKIEITGDGTGLHWPLLNVDHYVLGLLEHKFGTKRWMEQIGRRGGLVRSQAKTEAAQKNGLRGGRPRLKVRHGR